MTNRDRAEECAHRLVDLNVSHQSDLEQFMKLSKGECLWTMFANEIETALNEAEKRGMMRARHIVLTELAPDGACSLYVRRAIAQAIEKEVVE